MDGKNVVNKKRGQMHVLLLRAFDDDFLVRKGFTFDTPTTMSTCASEYDCFAFLV